MIIGAAGGIGSALCRRLHGEGFELVLAGRRADALAALAAELGDRVTTTVLADAASFENLGRAVGEAGHLDGLVNCAGSLLLKPAHLTSEQEFRDIIEANLVTAFSAVQAGARSMTNSGGGSIVLCSSAAGRIGLASHEAIAAAKAGVIGLTAAAAASYGARGIRVNCVAPGLVETPLAARITGNAAALETSRAMHALGRIGKPDDVAAAIAWLLKPESAWVTGQTIGVDGGLGTVRAR